MMDLGLVELKEHWTVMVIDSADPTVHWIMMVIDLVD